MILPSHDLQLTFSNQAPTVVRMKAEGQEKTEKWKARRAGRTPTKSHRFRIDAFWGMAKQMGATIRLNPWAQRGRNVPSDAFHLCDVSHLSTVGWCRAEGEKAVVMKFL